MLSIDQFPLWQVIYARSRNGAFTHSALIRAATGDDACLFVMYRYPNARILTAQEVVPEVNT